MYVKSFVVARHLGYWICRDEEDGLYWAQDGYFDSFEEVRASIEDWVWEEEANDPAWPPYDTPALDDSFHRQEMDVD